VTKVLYVMGSVRSGSTILGVALGNCDGVFYAGELDQWLRRCGEPVYRNPGAVELWGAVAERLRSHRDLCGDACFQCFEHSTAVGRPGRRLRARRLRQRYRAFNRDLYAALAEVTGAEAIADSAHYPLRARELRRTPGIELHVVFLVRDPHSVVEAFRTNQPDERKGLLAANAYLLVTQLLSLAVYLTHPRDRRLVVRHEDFAARPGETLQRVLDVLGSPARLPDLARLGTGTPLAGNGILRKSEVAVDPSLAAPVRRRSSLTAALQLPWTAALARLAR
jgi:hypothetical protein